VIEIMAEATNVIAEGEVLQLMNARDPDTSEQRYLEVIHRKTASCSRPAPKLPPWLPARLWRCSRRWRVMESTSALLTSS